MLLQKPTKPLSAPAGAAGWLLASRAAPLSSPLSCALPAGQQSRTPKQPLCASPQAAFLAPQQRRLLAPALLLRPCSSAASRQSLARSQPLSASSKHMLLAPTPAQLGGSQPCCLSATCPRACSREATGLLKHVAAGSPCMRGSSLFWHLAFCYPLRLSSWLPKWLAACASILLQHILRMVLCKNCDSGMCLASRQAAISKGFCWR